MTLNTDSDKHDAHSDLHRSEASDLLQFVLDCLEEIRRCVQVQGLDDQRPFTIEAVIEAVSEDILLYAKSKGLL